MNFFDKLLLPSQCGFRKGYSSRHCLLALLEKFKKSADNKNKFGTLLSDISKAFDCIDHKHLIAKLFWYGISPSDLNLIHSYLTTELQG